LNNRDARFNYFSGAVEQKFLIENGELLFAWSGTPGTSFGAHVWDRGPAILNQHIFRVLEYERLFDKAFLRLAINERLGHLINLAHGGAGLAHVTKPMFEATELLLPPLNEQRRIVAKLEALQSRTRRAREALEAVPPLLDKLRQSILAAAFRGDLTKDWRAQHPDVEPASDLLKRIRIERRKKWEEAELAKMKAKGKAPADDRWKAKYVEPKAVDASGLPELPRGWCWASVDELTSFVTDGEHATPCRTSSGILLLSARNVRDGRLHLDNVDYISLETHEKLCQRLRIRAGDVLLSCSGSVGRSCVVPQHMQFSLVRSVAVLRTVGVKGDWLSLALRSPLVRALIDETKTETAQANLFQGKIRPLPIPLAPAQEQPPVLDAVTAALTRRRAAKQLLKLASNRLAVLERALLATAFRGALVPQDPTDEPAVVTVAQLAGTRSTHRGGELIETAEAGAPPRPLQAGRPQR
jgi:type I restriction enzyme S subunit